MGLGDIVFIKDKKKLGIIINPDKKIVAVTQNDEFFIKEEDIIILNKSKLLPITALAKSGILSNNISQLTNAFNMLRGLNNKIEECKSHISVK